jgi:hypothetical protein
MARRTLSLTAILTAIFLTVALAAAGGASARGRHYVAGSAGVGDPYYPLYGNGGYNVGHYLLKLSYSPSSDRLHGKATISARATQNLYQFNLDLQGLHVRSVAVDGERARWSRSQDHELTIRPRHKLDRGDHFTTVIRYGGVPRSQVAGDFVSGFLHTDDGALIAGEPEVAANWFPVNDHPSDKASYTIKMTVPAGLEVVSNGELLRRASHHGRTTWTWNESSPMASYLATATLGQFRVHAYQANGLQMYDAVDPDLYQPLAAPRTGNGYVFSQRANSSYKRLTRTLPVPAAGGHLSFWIARDTEQDWDFAFVEARTPGQDDWTTLPDVNGHTSQDVGFSCPNGWLGLHPQLAHYQTATDAGCDPTGTTGAWWAATGASDGWEQWDVDLSAWAGASVEVSIAYASDEFVQGAGVFLDDIVGPAGVGSTSFEDDTDPMDGWTVSGAPAGSEPNANDFTRGSAADAPSTGDIIDAVFARQPEILGFLASNFGPYPFSSGGGIVDDWPLQFALENQTRTIYSKDFFSDEINGAFVVVHENAHQWYGDDVSVGQWRDIWLNEGFATYAEWLWSEHEDLGTAQENFDFWYNEIPADDPFWSVVVADPGVEHLFDGQSYIRGAMTLHQLRLAVGDDAFFTILRDWASSRSGKTGTTVQFERLAERVSGQQLDALFQTWLFTPEKPVLPAAQALRKAGPSTPPAAAASELTRMKLSRS